MYKLKLKLIKLIAKRLIRSKIKSLLIYLGHDEISGSELDELTEKFLD